jgi:hypothetical protein
MKRICIILSLMRGKAAYIQIHIVKEINLHIANSTLNPRELPKRVQN